MTKFIHIALALIAITGAVTFGFRSHAEPAAAATEERAIFVWWQGYEILAHQSERDNFFRIAQTENITDVYMHMNADSINWFTPNYQGIPNAWATFISQCKSHGIGVHALFSGDAPTQFTDRTIHTLYIQKIIQYNIANPTNRFEGINWDFEPLVPNHVPLYTDYIRAMKAVSYGGQTIVSQGLTLSVYLDPPKWLIKYTGATLDAVKALYREFNEIDLNTYEETLAGFIYHAADGPSLCQELGINFKICLETDIRSDTSGTLFEEGKDAYHTLQAQISAYLQPLFSRFVGQVTDQYQESISRWDGITATSWPQGQFQPGQTVSVTTTLQRSDSYPSEVTGVKLQIRSSNGTIVEVSKLVVMGGMETRQVTLQWIVPSSASGSYDLAVSTWDVDTPSRGSTLLTTDFGGNTAAVEAMTMAQLEARTGLSGKRTPFAPMDNTGWHNAYITVGSVTPPPTTTAPPPTTTAPTAIDIGSGVQDFNNHFGAGYTIVDRANPANASGTITSIDMWAFSNLTGVKVAAFYLNSGNVLTSRGSPAFIGNVTAGSKQTFTGLSIPVQAGDFIGIYMATGEIEYSTTSGTGTWEKAGDFTSSSNTTFTNAGARAIGLYGYSTTTTPHIQPPPPPPTTTVTDVGSGAQDFNNHFGAGYTIVDRANPANASGTITSIDIWANSNLAGVKVAAFYLNSGNVLTSRGSPAFIGNVTAGSKQTFTGLSIPVQAGDFIGIYMATGEIEYSTTSGTGTWEKAGDFTSSSNTTFTNAGVRAIGLYGYSTH